MPKKTTEQRVLGWLDKWKPRLLLDGTAIILKMQKEDKPKKPTEKSTIAEIGLKANPAYTEAEIDIYPSLSKYPLGCQQETIVHELSHIPTWKVKEALELAVKRGVISEKRKIELVEDLTEHIAKILWRAYSRGKKHTKGYHL